MNDLILVSNLCIHGFHGVHPEETRLGQKFYIDIECTTDVTLYSLTDDHENAICYGALCDMAASVSRKGPYKLIEAFGERLAQKILERFSAVTKVKVRIHKPHAPLAHNFGHVGVEIVRERNYRIGLSLGSNMGDKIANIRTALTLLNAAEGIEIENVSRFYRTAPWGNKDQEWFVNACATGWTTRQPLTILKLCKRIEVQVGRAPGERWGPRAIDMDLLFADDVEINNSMLTLPHPGIFSRSFVLIPLAEIARNHKIQGRRVGDEADLIAAGTDEIAPIDAG